MDARTKYGPSLIVVVGVALLMVPAIISPLPIGEPTYEYRANHVSVTNDGVRIEGTSLDAPGDTPHPEVLDDDLYCLGQTSRLCAFERFLLDGNQVPSTYTPLEAPVPDLNDKFLERGYVYLDGSFYRQVIVSRNGTPYLALNETPGRTALQDLAAPTDVPPRNDLAVRAVENGRVETRDRLTVRNEAVGDGTIVSYHDELFVLYFVAESPSTLPSWVEPLVLWGSVLLGLGLTLWGQHRWLTRGRRTTTARTGDDQQ